MRSIRFVWLLLVALLISGCGDLLGSSPTATPAFIIVDPPTAAPAGTARPQATQAPRATTAPAQPTSAATPQPDTQATPAPTSGNTTSKGTITVAFDAFPSYYPLILIEQQKLLEQRGYQLQLIPFDLNDQNSFSESERWEKLRSGEWDVLATTLDGFASVADPAIGAVTTIVDESAGADLMVVQSNVANLNSLRGKRIAFVEGSVSEYFLYYALSLAGLTPSDVQLVSRSDPANPDTALDVDGAVAEFTEGRADAVVAWTPNIDVALQGDNKNLIASDKLRAVVDVLISSRPAIDNRPEALQAFHDAWYEALKLMVEQPDVAEQALIDWGNSDWTGIAAPGDLAASLQPIAQATLGANALVFRDPTSIANRIREAQAIWARSGVSVPSADLATAVDGRFVVATNGQPGLGTRQPPINDSFLFTANVELPALTSEQIGEGTAIVQLPLERVDFEPESTRLSEKGKKDLREQVLPVLQTTRLYLRVQGSAAFPAGPQFSEDGVRTVALGRANAVVTYLTTLGVDPDRFVVEYSPPSCVQCTDPAQQAADRFVRMTLIDIGR
jgi:NitT/TauT family transport system substrate-binding protein